MNLLKTKFYPVDIENKKIFIEPFDRERDLADRWSRGNNHCIGLRGAHLMAHKLYHTYQPVPTVTQWQLVKEWDDEVARSTHLWESAAIVIRDTIRDRTPEDALKDLKGYFKRFRSMAISASYERAIRDVRELLAQQAQAA